MVAEAFRRGVVIPAHPLALTRDRKLDERRQRALTRYYLDAGAGGLAVGVHTTQFAIRDPAVGLLARVLEIAAEEAKARRSAPSEAPVLIAGSMGGTAQAVAEARLAASFGYNAVLLAPDSSQDEDELIERAVAVGEVLPVVGFYLQRAVGGRPLSREFWERFASLEAVVGIKIAPFDRYQTLDVLMGVARSGRASAMSLYTGNDDHIAMDLLAQYSIPVDGRVETLRFVGGLARAMVDVDETRRRTARRRPSCP